MSRARERRNLDLEEENKENEATLSQEDSTDIEGDSHYTHMASEEVRLRPSPLAPPPSAFEAATNREPTSLLGRIASPT